MHKLLHLLFGLDAVGAVDDRLLLRGGKGGKIAHGLQVLCQCHAQPHGHIGAQYVIHIPVHPFCKSISKVVFSRTE